MSRPRLTPEMAMDAARKNFQTEVKIQRVRCDISQKQLGEQVGVGPAVMSSLLANPDKIGVGRLRAIIRALELDPVIILRLVGYSDKDIRKLRDGMNAAV